MAMRRFRIKAVANLSASRGRSIGKSQQNDTVDENKPVTQETKGNISTGSQLPEEDESKAACEAETLDKPVNDTSIETIPKVTPSYDATPTDSTVSVKVSDISQCPVALTTTDAYSQVSDNYNLQHTTQKSLASKIIDDWCNDNSSSPVTIPETHTKHCSVGKCSESPDVEADEAVHENVASESPDVEEVDEAVHENVASKLCVSYNESSDSSVSVSETLTSQCPIVECNENATVHELDDNLRTVGDLNVSGFSDEGVTSAVSTKSSVAHVQDTASAETSKLSAQNRLARKRVKPSICVSLVNRKARERPMGICNKVEKISDCLGQQKNPENIPALQTDVEVDNVVSCVPDVEHRTESVLKCNGGEPGHLQTCTFGVSACGVNSCCQQTLVTTPLVEKFGASKVLPCYSPPKDTPNNLQDKHSADDSSPSKMVPKSESTKTCGTVTSFRSRFIKPKPRIVDVSSRRSSRSVSVESVGESDGEKKSLSSVSTASPPYKPQILGSRSRLNRSVTTEKSGHCDVQSCVPNADESDNGAISDATTESPPQKRVKWNSDGESDVSQTESYKDTTGKETSPLTKTNKKTKEMMKRTEFVRRVIEIKKEISTKLTNGKINKSRLTMFDLIYYNPKTNPMKPVTEFSVTKAAEPKSDSPESEVLLAEESIDEPEPQVVEEEDQSSSMPVPQVKVGPNGEIILDEQSLVIETTDAQKNWNDLQNSEVVMDYGNGTTTFNAYSKKKRKSSKYWNTKETLRFYRALHTVGTDFLVMQSLFPKLTRNELKNRFKREERENGELVEKALRNPLTFDLTALQKEFEMEREEEENMPPPEPKKRTFPHNRRNLSLASALDSTDTGIKRAKRVKSRMKKESKHKIKKKKTRRVKDETTKEAKCEPDPPECVSENNNTSALNEYHNEETGNQETSQAELRYDSGEAGNQEKAQGKSGYDSGETANEETAPVTAQAKATRSGRIPRPRIFEDFMTDNLDDISEDSKVRGICEKVTVEDICQSVSVEDEDSEVCENTVSSNDGNMLESDSEEDDIQPQQNFTMAEDGLTVHENGVTLGSVYSNVKPGTLIVLATESPENPGHQIFRVFMVSNNSETVPVSVSNSDTSATDNNSAAGDAANVESSAAANNTTSGCSNFKVG